MSDDGHWRKLDTSGVGEGPSGQTEIGRTWVNTNRLRPGATAKPHQTDFAKAVLGLKYGDGIIAAHGTGTGKSFVAVNAFEQLKGEGKATRALVLTPAGLRNNFLEKGVQKFTTSKGVILNKPEAVPDDVEYAVVSYDAFRRHPKEFLAKLKPSTVIADEIHRAVNQDSKTFQSVMEARRQVPQFIGMTASIAQNKPDDIVPLIQLASNGQSPIRSREHFRRQFVRSFATKQRGVFGGKLQGERLVNPDKLFEAVGSNIHYLEDLDGNEKPQKVVETVKIPMSAEQVDLYRKSMKGIDPKIQDKIRRGEPVPPSKQMEVFTSLLRARQVSNSLNSVLDITPEESVDRTPKMKRILDDAAEHLAKTPDGQVILYTNLVRGGVDVLAAGLKQRGIPFGVFAGKGVPGMTEDARQKAVKDYERRKNRAIIITGAGAEGLSLGNTTMVQNVDGHYNPERINQAEARGIRSGGLSHRSPEERKVEVRRYVSTLPKNFLQKVTFREPDRSVEEFVYDTARRKTDLNTQLREALAKRSEHERRKRESTLYRIFGGGP